MTTELALPKDGNVDEWTDSEKALVEAAGLVSHGRLAPRATVEAFLSHCQRTGLDPIARHIYAIERGGRWTIQMSIDGARLVAERTGEYEGQTPAQWTGDGREWVDVWLDQKPPAAARVGVYRKGFREAVYGVATWAEYSGGQMARKMPAHMLAKTAESLALRKAFPLNLSGLYTAEEMDQAGHPPVQQGQAPQVQQRPPQSAASPAEAPHVEYDEDGDVVDAEIVEDESEVATQWVDAIHAAETRDQLMAVWDDAKAKRAHTLPGVRDVFAQRGRDLADAA
jgi:phage recombination protein Bet